MRGGANLNWIGYMQQFGRSLMMPMIALPAAAVFLRLGSMDWGSAGVSDLFTFAGMTIFTYLPYLFAVGVALGLTESSGIAGLSGLVGYFLYDQLTQTFMQEDFHLGVLGGITIGLLAAFLFQRFRGITFPEYLQFFGGPRFVLLMMCFLSVAFSFVILWIGPSVQYGLYQLGQLLLSMGGFGVFLYGIFHRLFVPSGLHHLLNNFVWFQTGEFERSTGEIVTGDLPRFFAGDPSAGIYMAGLYPIVMFALPAIAFAIIHEAREDLKPKVKATFLIAALTSFLTGVTEPIEFAFLFVAPYLFIFHAILSGFSMWIAYVLEIHHGFSFSAGAIDYFLNYHLSQNGWLIFPLGLAFGLFYYIFFRWAIRRFRLPTPGREEGSALEDWAGDIPYRAPLILQALGGKENLVQMEACITRLRITLVNVRAIDTTSLYHLGAAGVITLGGGNIQVVFGTYSELIREEIMKVIRKDTKVALFRSPIQGRMIPLTEVPDRVFADKIVGEGVAFLPERGELVAPIAGEITLIYPSQHAIGIKTAEGLQLLLHIGIDSAQVPEQLFVAQVKVGDFVVSGQSLIIFDLQQLRRVAKSTAIPMVITNPQIVKNWSFAPYKPVRKGYTYVMFITLKEAPPHVTLHSQI